MIISWICYDSMHKHHDDGSPGSFYTVQCKEGFKTSVKESQIKLIERGNVWKYYNNQPLSFINLREEIDFFYSLGQARLVLNPRTSYDLWPRAEVISALKKGTVHGVLTPKNLLSQDFFSVLRFKDETLRQRIAQATLADFNISA